jgi:uncharacterized membrane protein YqiK
VILLVEIAKPIYSPYFSLSPKFATRWYRSNCVNSNAVCVNSNAVLALASFFTRFCMKSRIGNSKGLPSRGIARASLAIAASMLVGSIVGAPSIAATNSSDRGDKGASFETAISPTSQPQLLKAEVNLKPLLIVPFALLVLGGVVYVVGLRIVSEDKVGIVVKKFSGKELEPGRIIARNGEAGYQAKTLAPGWHWGFWPWQYDVELQPLTVIPQGQIGLVVAKDGDALPAGRILGHTVDCNNFQDADKFLAANGQKGRQLGILSEGTYRINYALFDVITAENCQKYDVAPSSLYVHTVGTGSVGIVTVHDGAGLLKGEIAGPTIAGHSDYQDGQAFISAGGCRGLQEGVLLAGSRRINPWFATVEQVDLTLIPVGSVGVVVSFVGEAGEDRSGVEFKYGQLVDQGRKGVWEVPLPPGKHPINTKVMSVSVVPTTNMVLNWGPETESHGYDKNLEELDLLSPEGFDYKIRLAQIIHVSSENAPYVISRVGSMSNLINHVLGPIVSNWLRNSAQTSSVLDFVRERDKRQSEAAQFIREALKGYNVEAIDTLFANIEAPEVLMATLKDRKLAEERQATLTMQQQAEKQRQQLVRQTAEADIQTQLVAKEAEVKVAEFQKAIDRQHAEAEALQVTIAAKAKAEAIELEANAEAGKIEAIGKAKAEAEAILVQQVGEAQADAYRKAAETLGGQGIAQLESIRAIGENGIKVTPDVVVGAGGGDLVQGMLGMLVADKIGQRKQSDSENRKQPGLEDSDIH